MRAARAQPAQMVENMRTIPTRLIKDPSPGPYLPLPIVQGSSRVDYRNNIQRHFGSSCIGIFCRKCTRVHIGIRLYRFLVLFWVRPLMHRHFQARNFLMYRLHRHFCKKAW